MDDSLGGWRKVLIFAAVSAIAVALVACGGPPEPGVAPTHMLITADVDRTTDWINSQGYLYYDINDDRVCQSPDSILEFRFPRDISDTAFDGTVQSDIVVWNEGPEAIRLYNYRILAVDDSSDTYQADLGEPVDVEYPAVELTTFTLQADQRIRLPFTINLDDGVRKLTRIAFEYQTGEMSEPIEVAVSYKPGSIRDEDLP